MVHRRMPTDEELRERYARLEQNEHLDTIANWKLPNSAKPHDEERDDEFLRFLDATGDSYYELVDSTLSQIQDKKDL